nr:reverse transcriptase domain-containing protein [Tanacetum cinerariifolium]GFB05929.1 reverse transcriptase domain-containing protein [Tanacetum cinerariifolium]GFB05975.1 reverse transcriptase domain-containing protein [Tanacetum cinerariifolium]
MNPTPKGRIRRSSKQKVENSNFEEHLPPVDTMADNRTMAEMLRAPTEWCAEAIMGQPPVARKEPPRFITTWDDLVSKFINEFFPISRTTNLRNEISNFHQKIDESFHEAWERYKDLLHQDSLNAAACGNLLEKSPQDALTIIENKSKINTASTSGSGSLPGNTIANPKGELKAITTCSGLVTDGPTVPTPPKSVTPEVDERVEETYTDPDLAEYIIKVPPPPVQKHKPPSQRNFVVHTRDSPLSNIPYPS